MGRTWLAVLAGSGLAQSQRKALLGRPFFMIWTGFALLVAPLCFSLWVAASLLGQALQPVGPVLGQLALTIAVFPIIAVPLIAAQRSLLKDV